MNITPVAIGRDAGGREQDLLRALTGIYLTLHVLDLQHMEAYEYATTENVHRLLHGKEPLAVRTRRVMDAIVVAEQKQQVLAFCDLDTLVRRLEDRDIIRREFISIYSGWFEASFIVMQRDAQGHAVWVVFVTRLINDRKEREEQQRRQYNTDEVTGFLNRRAYEEVLASNAAVLPEDNFIYVAFDVNGLKEVNDSLGHEAGDELLRGAAECISSCFGPYGQVFRTGGDEFVGLIYAEQDKLLDMGFAFEKKMAGWHGKRVRELSISWGSASKQEYPQYTMQELARMADRVMYRAKEKHYMQNGLDRRAQRTAYDAICSTFTKALQLDLQNDTYLILQMDGLEHAPSYGFSDKNSQWLHDFVMTGGVHEDDRAELLQKLQTDELQKYFQAGGRDFCLYYRRKIRGRYKKVMLEIIPAPEYSAERQLVYLFVKDIEK